MRPLILFGLAGGFGLAAFHLAEDANGVDRGVPTLMQAPLDAVLGGGYRLSDLEILRPTLFYVDQNYVEPNRVDYEKMYVAALEAVERHVPVCMFSREPGGHLLHVEIGEHREILDVEPIKNEKTLRAALVDVAMLLEQHLSPDDIPLTSPENNPYAEIEYAMANGVLSTLDPHSLLLPPEDSKEMDVDNEGEFGGLGITIVPRDGKITIEYPITDTPADRAGLLSDDTIVRIEGESTINMSLDEAVERLRGPVGAPVTIEIMREGFTEPRAFTIFRAKIKINPVEAQLLEGDIGYVTIRSFHAAASKDLKEALGRLTRETSRGELRGLVLDLRANPGGYLTQAVAVSDAFIESGMIVAQVDGQGQRESEERAGRSGTEPDYPIVVLVNASSASASEIVAGALRNNERAVIVGERTFGKGSVQNLYGFADSSKLKLTISKYLTPGDRSIQSVGIPADIALVPVIAEWRKHGGEDTEEPIARVYWRERVRREADLDKHLEHDLFRIQEPAYSVRYLRAADVRRRSADLDVSGDFEVQFSRDVLLAASSHRRADVLASVGTVVSKHSRQQEAEIVAGFAVLGIDWQDGPGGLPAELEVHFDLGEDGVLLAGEEEVVTLEVTNRGEDPLYRMVGTSKSDSEILDGREFVLGYLAPGETTRFEQKVKVIHGYPAEFTPVTFAFRDASDKTVATVEEQVPVRGRGLPALAWRWTVTDPAPGGDGDGIADLGETLVIDLTVENQGEGPTAEAFARIKNQSGRALDIVTGTLEIGDPVDGEGKPCVDPEGDSGGEATVKCEHVLAPGESWSGAFEIQIREIPRGRLSLELSLGDDQAYDHASIMRAGFYEFFTNNEDIVLTLSKKFPSAPQRQPPVIEVTRAPEVVSTSVQAAVSGRVSDDVGIAHVVIFHGDDKVFFTGGGDAASALRSVPFTAEVRLEPGLNTLTVLAEDVGGITRTRSVVTYYADPEKQAHARAIEDDAPVPH